MKKQVVLGAMLALLFMGTAAAYTDVPDSHWAKAQIERLSEEGIISGYPDNTFRPEQTLSRGEFIALFTRVVMPENINEMETSVYWWEPYYDAIATHSPEWIAEWFSEWVEDKFGWEKSEVMDRPITRFEVVKLATKGIMPGIGSSNYMDTISFSDITFANDGYFDVLEVAGNGILTGYADGSFRGNQSLTRAEASTILARLKTHQREGERLVVVYNDIIITDTHKDNMLRYQSINMITGEELFAVTITGANEEHYALTCMNDDNYFWGLSGLFRYEADGTIQRLTECVDKMVVQEAGVLIAQTTNADTVTFRSFDKETSALADTLTVPIILTAGEIGDFSTINSNSKYFWGHAGLFSYEDTGKMQQLISEPVVDYSYDMDEKCFVIVTQPADEKPCFYSRGATFFPYGTQLVSIYEIGGARTVLFENDEFIIVRVSPAGGVVTFESIDEFYGHSDSSRLTYRLENGKLRVLSSTKSWWGAEEIAREQAKLDEKGIGIGSR